MFAIKSLCAFLLLTNIPSFVAGWQPLGSTIIHESFSSNNGLVGSPTVDISHDGRRVAVGVPHAANGTGAVFVYELTVDDVTTTTTTSWNLLTTLSGETGEGLGNVVSLSPDGQLLAVRRHLPTNHVQVYHILPDNAGYVLSQIGSDKKCPESSYGQSVTLGQPATSPLSPFSMEGKYWLVYGCESYDNGSGKVHIYHLHQDRNQETYHWSPFVSHLDGSNAGDGFGSAISLVHAPSVLSPSGRIVRLAVSSPGYNNGQGRVQVFVANIGDDKWMQQGEDLKGSLVVVGEAFGASLDMSATEYPYVVVGSPQYNHADGSQGMVYLFHWRSPNLGVPRLWQLVDSVRKQGSNEFGRSVSISSNGNRLAASSHNVAALYELEDYRNLTLVSDLMPSPVEAVNTTIALNGPGSVLVSTSSSGEVHVVMDDSSFCQTPRTDAPTMSFIDMFLARSTCRVNGIRLVSAEELCLNTSVYMNGMRACEWIPPYDTSSPTVSPSMLPSETPSGSTSTAVPTVAPSPAPSFGLPNSDPTVAPPLQPTSLPSTSSSDPSSTPTQISPTLAPSSLPGTEGPAVRSPSPTTLEPSAAPSSSPNSGSDSSESPTSDSSMIGSEIVDPLESPSNDDFELLTACFCNETHACTKSRLEENAEVLRICINKHSSDFVIVDLDNLKFVQGNLTTPMVVKGKTKFDNVSVQCNEGSCQILLPVHSDLFSKDRPPYLAASGEIEVTREQRNLRSRRRLKELMGFGTIVLLEQATLATESTVEASIKKSSHTVMSPLMWFLVALILVVVALVAGRSYLKFKSMH
jgi:hypothetical protein